MQREEVSKKKKKIPNNVTFRHYKLVKVWGGGGGKGEIKEFCGTISADNCFINASNKSDSVFSNYKMMCDPSD